MLSAHWRRRTEESVEAKWRKIERRIWNKRWRRKRRTCERRRQMWSMSEVRREVMGHLKEWEQDMEKKKGGYEGRSCLTSCGACITAPALGPDWRRWEVCKETGGSTTAPDPVREKPFTAWGWQEKGIAGQERIQARQKPGKKFGLRFFVLGRMWLTHRKTTVNFMMKAVCVILNNYHSGMQWKLLSCYCMFSDLRITSLSSLSFSTTL